jgi:hypothetical protein
VTFLEPWKIPRSRSCRQMTLVFRHGVNLREGLGSIALSTECLAEILRVQTSLRAAHEFLPGGRWPDRINTESLVCPGVVANNVRIGG